MAECLERTLGAAEQSHDPRPPPRAPAMVRIWH
ncbi:hypothetical protein predicted by Glimmer/Critica [Sorangium cellulosum So ce56]|uniref:Uncharacterized protein n=1 Tax=Sorangium cellulosum (strain So ce56) TaxID=448385 RepID=A9GRT2_SORC5|nr:hypothetical protein predicted by Glimmer/Critica [Sorangium cellulosum So ce56]